MVFTIDLYVLDILKKCTIMIVQGVAGQFKEIAHTRAIELVRR
jgi:hypothetical protein